MYSSSPDSTPESPSLVNVLFLSAEQEARFEGLKPVLHK